MVNKGSWPLNHALCFITLYRQLYRVIKHSAWFNRQIWNTHRFDNQKISAQDGHTKYSLCKEPKNYGMMGWCDAAQQPMLITAQWLCDVFILYLSLMLAAINSTFFTMCLSWNNKTSLSWYQETTKCPDTIVSS